MSFISKFISWKKVLVIDVGTYKVKVACCEFKNSSVTILWYAEKRQETSHIIGSEIANIEWVALTIEEVIEKALKWVNSTPKDIIINIPTSTIVSSGNKIMYARTQKETPIDLNELDYIIAKAEKQALNDAKREITKKTWYLDVDMKLITSSITNIKIDNFSISNPIGFTGENVVLSTLNIFIPSSRYNIIQMIARHLNKNILSIIPLEFSLPKLFENTEYAFEDIFFIDIGNTKTSLIIQKKWIIESFDKIDIGMNDLIKNIKEKTWSPKLEIIHSLENEKDFLAEKKDFLAVWWEAVWITLKELLKTSPLPANIFLSWWGNNNFIRENIKNFPYQEMGIIAPKNISQISQNFENHLEQNSFKEIFEKSNLWLLSMILATKEIVNYKNNPVVNVLREFLEKNEF